MASPGISKTSCHHIFVTNLVRFSVVALYVHGAAAGPPQRGAQGGGGDGRDVSPGVVVGGEASERDTGRAPGGARQDRCKQGEEDIKITCR